MESETETERDKERENEGVYINLIYINIKDGTVFLLCDLKLNLLFS